MGKNAPGVQARGQSVIPWTPVGSGMQEHAPATQHSCGKMGSRRQENWWKAHESGTHSKGAEARDPNSIKWTQRKGS